MQHHLKDARCTMSEYKEIIRSNSQQRQQNTPPLPTRPKTQARCVSRNLLRRRLDRALGYLEPLERVAQERQVLVCAARIGRDGLFGCLIELVGREVRCIGDGA